MKVKILGLILGIALTCSPAAANVYTLNDTIDINAYPTNNATLTATGTITADGFMGAIPTAPCCLPPHILDWNITIGDGTYSQTLLGPVSGGPAVNSFIGGLGGPSGANGSSGPNVPSSLIATPKPLIWNYHPNALFNIQTFSANVADLGFTTNGFVHRQGKFDR